MGQSGSLFARCQYGPRGDSGATTLGESTIDLPDHLCWVEVEPLGAGLDAVHDGMAIVEPELVLEGIEARASCLVVAVLDLTPGMNDLAPAWHLQDGQNCVSMAFLPPPRNARRPSRGGPGRGTTPPAGPASHGWRPDLSMSGRSLQTRRLPISCPTRPDAALRICGARVHSLRGFDVDIPKDHLVVLTGVSGSGKSSLAFDTLYAEG